MADRVESLQRDVGVALADMAVSATVDRGELTIEVVAADLVAAARILRDDDSLAFSTLVDLCANDYEGFARTMLRAEMAGTRPYGPAMPGDTKGAVRLQAAS